MKLYSYPSALTIAGFDGSGGAGIQADIKTLSALGVYATSVLTSLPVQNTSGLRKIYPISPEAVGDQIAAVMDDIFPDAIKIGMVHSSSIVEAIAKVLVKYRQVPVVFDPVMVATSGHELMEHDTLDAIREYLLPLVELVTPNMDEAGVLSGMKISHLQDMIEAGSSLSKNGCKSVLIKGGHLRTERISSVFFDALGERHILESDRVETFNTHGTGCTLSSAITAYRAQKKPLAESLILAQRYVSEAIRAGSDVKIGKGKGPLNHFFDPKPLLKHSQFVD